MTHILTYTGVAFDLANPQPHMVRAVDIAVALSRTPRFNGHTREFYSVAQHSAIMSELCHLVPRAGLLHDAAEAYTGDCVRPLKAMLGEKFRLIEQRIEQAIERAFGLREGCFQHVQVKHNDLALLATERRDLMPESDVPWCDMPPPFSCPITPLNEEDALKAFCEQFREVFTRYPEQWDAWRAEQRASQLAEVQ